MAKREATLKNCAQAPLCLNFYCQRFRVGIKILRIVALQMGHLEVVISPDILPDNESSEGMAVEGGTIRLKCKATGVPEPTVLWRREDGNNIILRPDGGRERQGIYFLTYRLSKCILVSQSWLLSGKKLI